MNQNSSSALTRDLFQLMKQFPRLKLEHCAVDGLTRSEYNLLGMLVINLDAGKQAFSVTEISNLLQITPAGVTHLINPLEAAGYIQRQPDPNDRRIVLVEVTPKGKQVAESLLREVQENLSGLVNYLGEDDSKILIHLMSRAIDYFNTRSE
ncbi:MAG: MarR family winged helix-turn-helix transcriptional regulator [Anaerolineales bacterium]|jgi:DNA-binding MarR family transcriptional regulator